MESLSQCHCDFVQSTDLVSLSLFSPIIRFFSKHPDAASLLGVECEGEEFLKTDSFVPHAKKFIGLCDSFMDMLGPDAELMAKILEEEGRKHAKFGVKLEHYPTMGEALISGVKTLDKKFNDDTELCWKKVYCGVTNDLGKANTFEKSGRRHTM